MAGRRSNELTAWTLTIATQTSAMRFLRVSRFRISHFVRTSHGARQARSVGCASAALHFASDDMESLFQHPASWVINRICCGAMRFASHRATSRPDSPGLSMSSIRTKSGSRAVMRSSSSSSSTASGRHTIALALAEISVERVAHAGIVLDDPHLSASQVQFGHARTRCGGQGSAAVRARQQHGNPRALSVRDDDQISSVETPASRWCRRIRSCSTSLCRRASSASSVGWGRACSWGRADRCWPSRRETRRAS